MLHACVCFFVTWLVHSQVQQSFSYWFVGRRHERGDVPKNARRGLHTIWHVSTQGEGGVGLVTPSTEQRRIHWHVAVSLLSIPISMVVVILSSGVHTPSHLFIAAC